MEEQPIIVLLTDFGTGDAFVGVMKGVIASICRQSRVIDLTHAVRAQDITEAAFHLESALPYFPDGTIFVCVVDPGVGTSRRPIAVEAGPFRFLAPDNGLLTPIFERWPDARCRVLDDARHHLPSPSSTFHGRDIFSPVAAHLATGMAFDTLGTTAPPESCTRIERFTNRPLERKKGWTGRVVTIDRFGNVVTSFCATTLDGGDAWCVSAGSSGCLPIVKAYGDVDDGMPLAYVGSSGMIEIAVRNGDASRELGIDRQTPIRLVALRRPE
ncbi:MAG: SAM-dependent chlorinase/fluorinase [Chlorobiaceae bacterium]|nr:SAM-dependent chlorinase/fluorinase [Chlorobiaceae bacterium]